MYRFISQEGSGQEPGTCYLVSEIPHERHHEAVEFVKAGVAGHSRVIEMVGSLRDFSSNECDMAILLRHVT